MHSIRLTHTLNGVASLVEEPAEYPEREDGYYKSPYGAMSIDEYIQRCRIEQRHDPSCRLVSRPTQPVGLVPRPVLGSKDR